MILSRATYIFSWSLIRSSVAKGKHFGLLRGEILALARYAVSCILSTKPPLVERMLRVTYARHEGMAMLVVLFYKLGPNENEAIAASIYPGTMHNLTYK